MANRTYASFWTREYSEESMLDHFERWLGTVPLSATRPGFATLTIRAVDPSETPLLEHDFRAGLADAPSVAALASEHRNADCSYEVEAFWDLWQPNLETWSWQRLPQRILLACQGSEYDGGVAAETGQYLADLGLEHLFTGHAGLLGMRSQPAQPANEVEAAFLDRMMNEDSLREYQAKTRENIQQLLMWTRTVESTLPVERLLLWSEGEENLEARLDEILAVR